MQTDTQNGDVLASRLTQELDGAKKRISANRDLLNENFKLGKLVLKERELARKARDAARLLEKENKKLNRRLSTLCKLIAGKTAIEVLEVFKDCKGVISAKQLIDDIAD